MRINRKPNVNKYRKSKEEKQAQKLALEEINSYHKDDCWKIRTIALRYGVQKTGFSEFRYYNKIIGTIKREIIEEGLTKDMILPRVHELLREKYGNPIEHVEYNINEIIDKSPEEQKEFLLETGQCIIYLETTYRQKNKNAGTFTRPKGLSDIIGGAYGNTAIRMETVTVPEYTDNSFKEWVEHILYLQEDKLTIPAYKINKSVRYENIDSITVDKDSPSIYGYHMTIKSDIIVPHEFRTPLALGLELLLKEKIPKKDAKKDDSSNMEELKMCLELYEKGLLTEEEFNTKKKELLGL